MKDKTRVSHSGLSVFNSCRRKFYWQYEEGIEPLHWTDSAPLTIGRIFHEVMEVWHETNDASAAHSKLSDLASDRGHNTRMQDIYCRLSAMVSAYIERYPAGSTPWEFIGQELSFDAKISNPATGCTSRSLYFTGRLDGLIVQDGKLGIYELKTTSRLDSGYLERLWDAPQTGLYSAFVSELFGHDVDFVVYDIVEKPSGRYRTGETVEEYEVRKAGLAAKSKSGTSNAQRRMPEDWCDFEARLLQSMSGSSFHRETILVTPDRTQSVLSDLWAQGQDILSARRLGTFYQNRDACHNWGRSCEFLPICNSRGGDSPLIIENLFKKKGGDQSSDHSESVESSVF